MNPNVGKYTYSEVKEMTIFRRYELFGCLEAEDVMKSMLRESKEDSFNSITEQDLQELRINDLEPKVVKVDMAGISQLEEMVDIHYIENN